MTKRKTPYTVKEDILELVSYNLNKEGYQVNRAMSGEKALQVWMRIRD